MDIDQQFQKHLERVNTQYGVSELQTRIERGDYLGQQREKVEAFISEVHRRKLDAYKLSPEYSAIRQANAAEQANKTAHRAYVVSLIAVAISVGAVLLQIFLK